MLLADLTEFPEIYSSVYWGRFNSEHNTIDELIIFNRNTFAKQYSLKVIGRYYPDDIGRFIGQLSNSSPYRNYIDHVEVYKSGSKYVIVISPYNHIDKQDADKVLKEVGFKEYNKLYQLHAYTYIKVCDGDHP
jgi:hypothetical protein